MRIAVLYPRGQKTGGPEAVHQFVDELRRQGAAAFVCPHPDTVDLPRVEAFEQYDAPEIAWAELRPEDVLVAAEIYARELLEAPTKRRVMWWLSVDNAGQFRFTRMMSDRFRRSEAFQDGLLKLIVRLVRERWWRYRIRRDADIEHIAQSVYAQRFVQRWTGRDVLLVSDFTVLTEPADAPPRKSTRIAFNPAKGGDIVRELAAGLADLEFVPLAGMAPETVAATLRSSGVYLDFGHHPGKDRIPREAAMLGCAVLVARRGSAAFDEDVELAARFKVDTHDLVQDGRRALRATIEGLDRSIESQESLRRQIRSERARFTAEVQQFKAVYEPKA